MQRQRRSLLPTDKGIKLIEAVPWQLSSPETTGRWEKGLKDIENGKMDPGRFMESIRRYSAFLVEAAKQGPGPGVSQGAARKDGKEKAQAGPPPQGGRPRGAESEPRRRPERREREGPFFEIWLASLPGICDNRGGERRRGRAPPEQAGGRTCCTAKRISKTCASS